MEQIFKEQKQILAFEEQLEEAVEQGLIHEWKIEVNSVLRNNTYLEKDGKVESQLEGLRENVHITLYKEYEDKLGEAGFEFPLNGTIEEFKEEVSDAAFITKENLIKKYELPKAEDENVQDNHINYEETYSKKLAQSLEEGSINLKVEEISKLFKKLIDEASDKDKEVILNSLEIFTKLNKRKLKTSKGIDKEQFNTGVYLDIALSAHKKDSNEGVEQLLYEHVNDLYTFDFESFFKDSIQSVKEKLDAKTMINFTGPILLSKTAALDFFFSDESPSPPLAHASARLKYEKISNYVEGQEIAQTQGDKLNFSIRPLQRGNSRATAFDTDGISAKEITIIENNRVKNFLANKQYADYLGITPSGPPGVFVVEGGDKSEKELREEEEEYIEINSFAWFNPSDISGDVSAEIRSAYYIKNGVKTPMKEGLFSGNLFKLLEQIYFSKEQVEKPGYIGPKVIKCTNAKIISS